MLLFTKLSKMPIAYQFPTLLIPEPVRDRFQAGNESDRLDLLKERVSSVACLQVVIRNAGTQVMDMVEADVAGEPLQDAG